MQETIAGCFKWFKSSAFKISSDSKPLVHSHINAFKFVQFTCFPLTTVEISEMKAPVVLSVEKKTKKNTPEKKIIITLLMSNFKTILF